MTSYWSSNNINNTPQAFKAMEDHPLPSFVALSPGCRVFSGAFCLNTACCPLSSVHVVPSLAETIIMTDQLLTFTWLMSPLF